MTAHVKDGEYSMAKKILTTGGILVADDQNSLIAVQPGLVLFKDVHLIKKEEMTL